MYQEDLQEYPQTVVSPISTEELIEVIKNTEPAWYKEEADGHILRPLEIHEVPAYA